eukprot:GHRQ01034293.1.p1 GENE.GHRQ01034293.1~~GHRQ01034293.1.p1  ORF type:complete len:193 (-),score=37.31 GHRQ01034293.1:189-767(-)
MAAPPAAEQVLTLSAAPLLQERAAAYIASIKQSADCWKLCCERFPSTLYPEVKFWCLQTLHEVLPRGGSMGRTCVQCSTSSAVQVHLPSRVDFNTLARCTHAAACMQVSRHAQCTSSSCLLLWLLWLQVICACYLQLDEGSRQMVRPWQLLQLPHARRSGGSSMASNTGSSGTAAASATPSGIGFKVLCSVV